MGVWSTCNAAQVDAPALSTKCKPRKGGQSFFFPCETDQRNGISARPQRRKRSYNIFDEDYYLPLSFSQAHCESLVSWGESNPCQLAWVPRKGKDPSNVVDYPLTASGVTTGTPEACTGSTDPQNVGWQRIHINQDIQILNGQAFLSFWTIIMEHHYGEDVFQHHHV